MAELLPTTLVIRAESFRGLAHLRRIQQEARAIVAAALAGAMR